MCVIIAFHRVDFLFYFFVFLFCLTWHFCRCYNFYQDISFSYSTIIFFLSIVSWASPVSFYVHLLLFPLPFLFCSFNFFCINFASSIRKKKSNFIVLQSVYLAFYFFHKRKKKEADKIMWTNTAEGGAKWNIRDIFHWVRFQENQIQGS